MKKQQLSYEKRYGVPATMGLVAFSQIAFVHGKKWLYITSRRVCCRKSRPKPYSAVSL
jgi:hypothetical protein